MTHDFVVAVQQKSCVSSAER